MPKPLAPLRILHAPVNVAGQAGDVVAALRRSGHDAQLWVRGVDAFGRDADRFLDAPPDDEHATWRYIREAAERFDVVHFHFARTLVPHASPGLPRFWDLPVYRALGLRVYFTFHGSDVRIGRVFAERNPWAPQFQVSAAPDDDRIEKNLHVMRTYADRLFVASPNSLNYVPDAVYLPRVIDLAAWPAQPAAQRRVRPVVVHAPSRRGTKGTDGILGDLEALRAEGLDFELRLLEGVPHEQVRKTLADADLLIDNTIGGSYGIVSLEALSLGKVAVSNMSPAMRAAHPTAPVVMVDPTALRDTLRRLLRDVDERQALAERGRAFVEQDHDADAVAATLVDFYTERLPERTRPAMPDWVSVERFRRIERLEERLDRVTVELERTRLREHNLRAQLGKVPVGWQEQRQRLAGRAGVLARRVTPMPIRRLIRRLRA